MKYANQADIKVYFVNYIKQAHWRKPNRFQGIFKAGESIKEGRDALQRHPGSGEEPGQNQLGTR